MNRLARAAAAVASAVALAVTGTAAPVGAATPSSTVVSVQGSVGGSEALLGYGQPVLVAAQVAVAAGVPDGWVFFVVDGVSRRVDVGPDGTAVTTVEGLAVGTHAVAATFVPRDPSLQDGSSSVAVPVRVLKVSSKPRVRVSGTRVGRVTHVRTRVRAPYGTTPTGRVSVTLRRRGSGWERVRGAVLEDGAARIRAGRLAQGRYRAVVRYRGDESHQPSRKGQVFRVRRH